MKYFLIVSLTVLLFSCGNSKKVIQIENEAQRQKTEHVYQDPEVPEIKRTHRPEESEYKLVKKDSVTQEVEEIKEKQEEISTPINLHKTSSLHSTWVTILPKYVSESGNVNYRGFASDKSFPSYLKALSEHPPQDNWSREDQLAYWINVYNAFTIKLINDNYPLQSIKDIKNPWDYRFIKIGPKWHTLNDVEHKILRKMDEPRIHFAINCASVSCPKLLNVAFLPETLESQLTDVTKDFLSDTSRNNISENSIQISKIFRWFGKDFKKDGSLIDFLNRYTEVSISDKAKVSYKDYDWNLNE